MGKHHRHAWKTMFHPEASHGSTAELERQLADSASHRTIEPDRDAAGSLSEREQHLRQAVHTDREPADDFHLAAQRAGELHAQPVPAGTGGEHAPEADRR